MSKQTPLWQHLVDNCDLYGSAWPPKLALILQAIAQELKTPDDQCFVCTTNDVARWLEDEARQAIEHQDAFSKSHVLEVPELP